MAVLPRTAHSLPSTTATTAMTAMTSRTTASTTAAMAGLPLPLPLPPKQGKRVSFAATSSVAHTHAPTDYDRSCIQIEPITGRDIAALRLFRLSLSLPTTNIQTTQSTRTTTTLKKTDSQSPVDWITSVAQAARFGIDNSYCQTSFASSDADSSLASVWDRVDQCCSQVLRCI